MNIKDLQKNLRINITTGKPFDPYDQERTDPLRDIARQPKPMIFTIDNKETSAKMTFSMVESPKDLSRANVSINLWVQADLLHHGIEAIIDLLKKIDMNNPHLSDYDKEYKSFKN